MLRTSAFHSSVALLSLIAAPLAAQDVDSVEVTPHNVTRPVTQNTGTGVGACQQFMPWAYDANGGRVRRQLTYVWSVSNSTDFEVDTTTGGVCARQAQVSDTVTTVVTATIIGEGRSGTSSFTVTPDPAMLTAPPAPPPTGVTQRQTNTTPAPAPTQVTVTAISPTTLQISWGGVAGASGYYLYRSASAGGSFTAISTALIQGNVTTDPTLTPNTTAYYKVATIVPNTSPGYSGAVPGTTLPAPAPASLTATLGSDQNSVTLSWPAPTGASGYRLLKNGTAVSASPLRSTSYTDNQQLLPLVEYRYQVAALYASTSQGEFEGDLTKMPTAKVTRTEAPYRLVFRGLKVDHQTQDDPLEADGKGDEVYLSSSVLQSDGNRLVAGSLWTSLTFGDKSGSVRSMRIKAGTASLTGGLVTGDNILFAVPYELWRGKLGPGIGVIITPTLWEYDGMSSAERELIGRWEDAMGWENGTLVNCIRSAKTFNGWANRGAIMTQFPAPLPHGCSVPWLGQAGPGRDRRIGHAQPYYKIQSLALTVPSAEGTLKGAATVDLAVPHADVAAGDGSYVIFLRLERVP